MTPTHVAKPQTVTAYAITSCEQTDDGYRITTADGGTFDLLAAELYIIGEGKPGDYLWMRPKEMHLMDKGMFEYRYMQIADIPAAPAQVCKNCTWESGPDCPRCATPLTNVTGKPRPDQRGS
ncbi:hypothetical protein [Massilia sp. TSP1-1-2]|uniref:hypothetical protein n=1 Tax=Massilia sp. TSP1-1-2 TaxID=2804649 RepID=UPI003CF49587